MKRLAFVLLSGILLVPTIGHPQTPPERKRVTLGFIEGGAYPGHAEFRDLYTGELRQLLPEQYELVLVPQGYKSAEWNRSLCREKAAELAADSSVHLIAALGPWVVEDLLAAGCDKPIIAAYRFDPAREGLVDTAGRPIAENLTVRIRPDKLEKELTLLTRMLGVKRLGFLYFPSGDETDQLLGDVSALGEKLGFRVITGEGYDNVGTYAFFKAFQSLPGKVDALYVGPLWAFTPDKIGQFFAMVNSRRVRSITPEGSSIVQRGALVSSNAESLRANAFYHAWKTAQIIQGQSPASLPTVFPERLGVIVNESTARLLGFELPDGLRYYASEVGSPPTPDSLMISLHDAVEQALQQNPGYQAKREIISEAFHAIKEARAAYLPQLGLSASATYYDDNTVHNSGGALRPEGYRAGLTLDQTLLSLETVEQIRMAGKESRLSEIDAEDAALDLELAVNIAYLSLMRSEEVLEAHRDYRRRIDGLVQIVEARQQLVGGLEADLIRWRGELSRSTQAVIAAETVMDISRILLNVLLNQPGNTPIFVERSLFSHEELVREYMQSRQSIGSRSGLLHAQNLLVREAREANPVLRRIVTELELQKIRLAGNRAGYYPRIGFQATLSWTKELADESLFEEKKPHWSIGALVDLPLFLGGARKHDRNRLLAEQSRIEFEKDAAALRAMQRIRTTTIDLAASIAILPFAEESQELSNRFRELADPKYFAGEYGYGDLLDAEQSATNSRLTMLDTRYRYFELTARLVREIGLSPHASFRTPGTELLRLLLQSPDNN